MYVCVVAETQTRQNVLRSEVANGCRQGPKIQSSTDKLRLVRTLGDIIATALGLPKATSSELMSPEVAAEYVVSCTRVLYRYVCTRLALLQFKKPFGCVSSSEQAISGRFSHNSAEFELKCSDGVPDGGPAWVRLPVKNCPRAWFSR